MRRLSILLIAVLLAGCNAPIPPVPRPIPFRSPLPSPRYTVYLPSIARDWYTTPISHKKGITEACAVSDTAKRQKEILGLRASWLWNWGVNPPLYPGMESVPNTWNASMIGQPLGGNSAWLLGFNEPDGSDQSNMTPEAAAEAWRRIEETYPTRKLTSPQVLHPGDWLERWYAAYIARYGQPPRLDALAIHTYYGNNSDIYIARVKEYIELAKLWNVSEVWVTEFALAPAESRSMQDAAADLEKYITWLEREPMVTRYAVWTNRVECMSGAYGFTYGGQFDSPLYYLDGTMTLLGKTYSKF